jgi:hypothetical protein
MGTYSAVKAVTYQVSHNQPFNEYKSGKQAGDLFQVPKRTLLNPPQTPHCLKVRKQAE